jgi:1-acyl-sn-glycerol-3-phosphate acyltransferase
MIAIVDSKPYRFVPPYPGTFWTRALRPLLSGYLRRSWGIEAVEFRNPERLDASLRAGHGVMLAPNHARPCDPMVVGLLPLRLGRPSNFVAASHVFTTGKRPRLTSWLLRRAGAFSIHRWGMDRESLKASIQILTDARRPLLLFPEGIITRTNDRLNPLLEGTAFIARSAARNRAGQSPPGAVVVHPVAVRYLFQGDLARAAGSVLEEVERRLTWRPRPDRPLVERVLHVGQGLLALKEIEYLGQMQTGSFRERLRALTEAILSPIEAEWGMPVAGSSVVERVKKLRTTILADLLDKTQTPAEPDRRWQHIADCYLAQQLDCYPGDYLAGETTVDRILETVERFEEDLTDQVRVHRPIKAIVQIGEAISVDPGRGRSVDETLMASVEEQLRGMLGELQRECRPFRGVTDGNTPESAKPA